MSALQKGSRGDQVLRLQEILNNLMAVPPRLQVDGIFGPKTEERVVTFQRQLNLTPDGIVGRNTNRALVASALMKPKQTK